VKVYFDACCLSRLTDDQAQPRIREEAEAIERVLSHVRQRSAWRAANLGRSRLFRRPGPAESRLRAELPALQ
jgi:hypothetical protein